MEALINEVQTKIIKGMLGFNINSIGYSMDKYGTRQITSIEGKKIRTVLLDLHKALLEKDVLIDKLKEMKEAK